VKRYSMGRGRGTSPKVVSKKGTQEFRGEVRGLESNLR
jgi:hypothetical protein